MTGDATSPQALTPTAYAPEDDSWGREGMEISVALCAGRHEIVSNAGVTITSAIFPQQVENPLDFETNERIAHDWVQAQSAFLDDKSWLGIHQKDGHRVELHPPRLNLYVTGLTPCLTAFLVNWGMDQNAELFLHHYDRDTGKYIAQYWCQ